ncbi:Ldh family oxidoreductase, partial [Amaricoccus solimangrovi]
MTGFTEHAAADLFRIAEAACRARGASEAMSRSLARASLAADFVGRAEVGLAHLLDYLDGLRAGRIDGGAVPKIDMPARGMIRIDAAGGVAQLGFDLVFDELTRRVKELGVVVLTQHDSFPCGELGYYARRLAGEGLVSLVAANANAIVAPRAGSGRLFSTNPVAFGAPLAAPRAPLVIDQASSASAFVNVARAAREGRAIPEGWAIDAEGQATTDPSRALMGALLPFGGYKGANIALMVEVLSAGLSGGNWSLDSPDFTTGTARPGTGMTIVALDPTLFDPEFEARLTEQVERLAARGARIPGTGAPRLPCDDTARIRVADDVYHRLLSHTRG